MMMMTPMWITMLKVLVLLTALFTSIVYINIEIMKRQEAELKAAKAEADFQALLACTMETESGRSGCYHFQFEAKEYDGIIQQIFKLNNEKGVVLFNKSAEVQSDQPHLQRHPSDTTYRPPLTPPLTPPQALANATDKLKPCRKNSSDQLKTFCTEVDDYPDLSKFKAKLEQTYAKFFMNEPQPTDVSSRVGGDSDELYLCKSTRRIIYPKKGQKSDNTWQLIVNDDEYKQGIQIEECEQEGSTCDYASNFPQHYRPICKQHYIQQTLVSIQGDDVSQGSFRIPSCCKCALKVL
ncbi:protein spaetzle isoform X6 [Drosophila biarmipes]|uniref:protein spaetzle isoform X6 n=1 Tax=Drosophila biarmipes TaxID=125945 RepID=UPI0007E79A1C|nr:protein spaetzle isoform X6 [Drosophila biarmipes]